MKLTRTQLSRIEGFGLILILLSFFTQSVQNDSESSLRESQNYHLNKKLDHIWIFVEKHYSGSSQKDTAVPKPNKDDWEMYSRQAKEIENWEKSINLFGSINTWIFVLGTILVIVPKFIDEK